MDGMGLKMPLLRTFSLTFECVSGFGRDRSLRICMRPHTSASTEITPSFFRIGDEDGFAVGLHAGTRTNHVE